MFKNGFSKFQNILIEQVKEKMYTEHVDFKDACPIVAKIYEIKPLYVAQTFLSFKKMEIILK